MSPPRRSHEHSRKYSSRLPWPAEPRRLTSATGSKRRCTAHELGTNMHRGDVHNVARTVPVVQSCSVRAVNKQAQGSLQKHVETTRSSTNSRLPPKFRIRPAKKSVTLTMTIADLSDVLSRVYSCAQTAKTSQCQRRLCHGVHDGSEHSAGTCQLHTIASRNAQSSHHSLYETSR